MIVLIDEDNSADKCDCLNWCGDDSGVQRGEIPRCQWWHDQQMAALRARAETINLMLDLLFNEQRSGPLTRSDVAIVFDRMVA